MLKNCELKRLGKSQFYDNWGFSVLVCLVIDAILSVSSCAYGLSILIEGPLIVGSAAYFVKQARGMKPEFGEAFSGFKNFGKNLVLGLLMFIFTFLWSLLLIVPGIIKGISYSMAPYIMLDHPEVSPRQAMDKSQMMMLGYKAKYFGLQLSFIGWILLSCLTCGVLAVLFVIPYMNCTNANFYNELKKVYEPDPVSDTVLDI